MTGNNKRPGTTKRAPVGPVKKGRGRATRLERLVRAPQSTEQPIPAPASEPSQAPPELSRALPAPETVPEAPRPTMPLGAIPVPIVSKADRVTIVSNRPNLPTIPPLHPERPDKTDKVARHTPFRPNRQKLVDWPVLGTACVSGTVAFALAYALLRVLRLI